MAAKDRTGGAKAEPDSRQGWQLWTTVLILIGFAVGVGFMLCVAEGNNADVWQRRIYVFAGVQAIVFTAVGWLFGREVNTEALKAASAHVEAAQASADEAKAESAASRAEASVTASALSDARSREQAVRAAVSALASAESRSATGPQDIASASPRTIGIESVQALIDQIYSD